MLMFTMKCFSGDRVSVAADLERWRVFESTLLFMQICSVDLGQEQKQRQLEVKLVIIYPL